MGTTSDNVIPFFATGVRSSPPSRLVPARLRSARIAKRLNQAELGLAIGKTRQSISSYELGEKTPEAATLVAIARTLDQPLAYFTSQDREGFGEFGARFFRAAGPETKRRNLMCDAFAAWQVQIARYIDSLVNYPPVLLPAKSPQSGREGYEEEEIEEAARDCRKLWGLGLGPLSNVLGLAEAKGIIVARLPIESERIDAFSFWNGARPFIFLASQKESAARARFDVAHEIGHLVLHRGIGQEEIEDPKILRRLEVEANRFAGALLLPRESFPNEIFTTRLEAFVELKSRWKVAIQAMVYRCKDLEVFDDYQITNLYKQISARRWRTKEPLDDPSRYPLEQPKMLRQAIEMIFAAGRKGPEDVGTELALAPKIIESLCNLPVGSIAGTEPLLLKPRLR
ncbi:MAG: ImmA/IrrE family metallo-endopeptidase [Alphaproteobacteria bacterium]|nr:ImmA/IrrE family metallo-endopeptidase [Alphaproteobacteria bacterium]